MKNCKKCGNKFEPVKGLLNYCSLECRNSRTWSIEDKEKKSISAKNSEKVKMANCNRPKDVWLEINERRKEQHVKKILESNYDELSFNSLRYRILYEQENKCNSCGISEWLGEPIILELEHIDGNHFNNERSNLEMICPNCHSQTSTWRGRNKTNKRHKISDEELFNCLLKNNWNMRQSLLDVGLAAKGGNYNRCHKLKKEYYIMTS
jgi:Zn finger protein HypA/HybF involved in hydrogenase expression